MVGRMQSSSELIYADRLFRFVVSDPEWTGVPRRRVSRRIFFVLDRRDNWYVSAVSRFTVFRSVMDSECIPRGEQREFQNEETFRVILLNPVIRNEGINGASRD